MIFKRIKSKLNKVRSKFHEHIKSRHRSSQWNQVRDDYLSKNSSCKACGGKESLQVHHIVPFHIDRSKELDPSNLICLCMGQHDCHLLIGHGGSFLCYNPNVTKDAKNFLAKSEDQQQALLKEIKLKRIK